MHMILAELVKDRVTVPALLDRYGVKVGHGGRCACPIHHGQHANMAVKPKWFRCYKCGKSGTVIDLQMALTGASFSQAITDLDAMFALNLTPAKPSERISARLAFAEHKRNTRARAARKLHNDHQYTILCYLRRFCAAKGTDCTTLDKVLDYYLGYDDDDLLPDALTLAELIGLHDDMEVMIVGAADLKAVDANDG